MASETGNELPLAAFEEVYRPDTAVERGQLGNFIYTLSAETEVAGTVMQNNAPAALTALADLRSQITDGSLANGIVVGKRGPQQAAGWGLLDPEALTLSAGDNPDQLIIYTEYGPTTVNKTNARELRLLVADRGTLEESVKEYVSFDIAHHDTLK